MKLKKNLKSKMFIAGSLAVLCVGVLVVYLALPKGEKNEFVPEPTPTTIPLESWTENSSPTPTQSGKETSVNESTVTSTPKEEYPKTVESNESKTVVEFTDPSPKKPGTPPAPEGKIEVADPAPFHPVKKDPTVTPSKKPAKDEPKQESKQESKPKLSSTDPGEKNNKGQVYDPVFGWVTPSDVKQGVIDGEGDPDKMVGEMD